MSPAIALKLLHDVQIGDILLETVAGRTLHWFSSPIAIYGRKSRYLWKR